jgi:hypothetical protein
MTTTLRTVTSTLTHILVVGVIFSLCVVFGVSAKTQTYPAGWGGLSGYRKIDFTVALKAEGSRVLIYYLEAGALKALRLDLISKDAQYVNVGLQDPFLCLTRSLNGRQPAPRKRGPKPRTLQDEDGG